MLTQNFTNVKLLINLVPGEPFTEFKFLDSVDITPQDETSTKVTSTGTVQVGYNSTGAEMSLENSELPDSKEHARLQARIIKQGKRGFNEAIFEGDANTAYTDGTVRQKFLMRGGTFIAEKKYSPTDMMNGSATLKASEAILLVDGYDGEGSYQDALNGGE